MLVIKQLWSRILGLPSRQLFLLLLIASFIFRLAFIIVFHTYRDLDRYELELTALSLAQHGVYGNPYAIPTGPTAHVSPGYTLILAGIFRLFGDGIPAEFVKHTVACFVTSVQYALLPWAAERLGMARRAGLAAAIVCILYPAKALVQLNGEWETPYTALFLIFLPVAAIYSWSEIRASIRLAVWRGLLWGGAVLFASVLLPIFICYLLIGFWFQRRQPIRYLQASAAEVAIVLLCLMPWAIRNQIALGEPIFTRSNLGIELHVSNNDDAVADQRENLLHGVYNKYHPLQNAGEARKVREMGEVRYNKAVRSITDQWIATHRQRFLALTMERGWKFWFYRDTTSLLKTVFLDVTGFLGIIGAAYLLVKRPIPGTAVALILLLYPAPNYLIHVGLRQRYPIDWLLTVLSAYVLFTAWDHYFVKRPSPLAL